MSSLLLLATALFLGASTTIAHPVLEKNTNSLPPRSLEPRSTFTCPIFDDYEGGYKTCSPSDLIWNNEEIFGKFITFYIPPDEKLLGQSSKDHIVSIIQESAKVGLSLYSAWAPGIQINMGLVDEIPDGSYGWTLAHTDSDEQFQYCNIVLNFPTDSDPDKRIEKAVVHELYHCIQFALNNAGIRAGSSAQSGWWIEGSARFFDGVNYPIQGGRDTMLSLGEFPEEYDPSVSLVEQKYTAALYFHFLYAGLDSLDTINRFITTKAGQDNATADLLDISGVNMFSHNWHGFARTFVDNNFKYTPEIPLIVEKSTPWDEYPVESMNVGDNEEREWSVDPFTFRLKYFTFPKGSTYSLTLPSGVQCSVRKWKTDSWHPGTGKAFTVDVGMGEDLVVEVLGSCGDADECMGEFGIQRIE